MKEISTKAANGHYEVTDDVFLRVWLEKPYKLTCGIDAATARVRQFVDEEDIQRWATRLLHRLYGAAITVNAYLTEFTELYAAYVEAKDEILSRFRDSTFSSDSERDEAEQRMWQEIAHTYVRLFDQYIVGRGIRADSYRINRFILSDIMRQRAERATVTDAPDNSNVKMTAKEGQNVMEELKKKVADSAYISNLRIGRSWILPKMVEMGMKVENGKTVFDIDKFEQAVRDKYNSSNSGRSEVWKLMKSNYAAIAASKGKAARSRWWTPSLLKKMVEWDRAMTGRATRGVDANECRSVSSKLGFYPEKLSANTISKLVDRYCRARMNKRKILHPKPLPEAFIDAFEGDGAYSAMMTMVKVLGAQLKDVDDSLMSRDQTIALIDKKAAELTGKELLRFCKARFFDSGIYEQTISAPSPADR